MVCVKYHQNMRVSPRLKSKSISNNSDLLSKSVYYNTSESSVSTCDSINIGRSLSNTNNKNNKKHNSSINNDDYLNSDNESDDLPILKSQKICKKCDQLTSQLTEIRIQDYDKWQSEIKTLEDMLMMKESIIEHMKIDCLNNNKQMKCISDENKSLIKSNDKLNKKITSLKDSILNKNKHISDLEDTIKKKNEIVIQQKRMIEKLEKLAEEDSKLIKKLRSEGYSDT